MKQQRQLSIELKSMFPRKYILIGAIYERSLLELNLKGFDSFHEAREAMKEYGYSEFKADEEC